jgi:predicted acyl esterase
MAFDEYKGAMFSPKWKASERKYGIVVETDIKISLRDGVKFYTWAPDDVKRVTGLVVEKVWPKMAAKSPDCAKMVDIVKKQLRDYGRIP